jgi:putative copper resistance protein D
MAWGMPLPVFALVGGVMLFLHSHGTHPAAHKIAIHHAVMGTTALVAGLCKVTAGVKRQEGRSPWGIAWAVLVLLIGIELLVYSE